MVNCNVGIIYVRFFYSKMFQNMFFCNLYIFLNNLENNQQNSIFMMYSSLKNLKNQHFLEKVIWNSLEDSRNYLERLDLLEMPLYEAAAGIGLFLLSTPDEKAWVVRANDWRIWKIRNYFLPKIYRWGVRPIDIFRDNHCSVFPQFLAL